MPRLLWKVIAPPRVPLGRVILHRYRVQEVINEGQVFQLLLTKNIFNNEVRAIRVLNRSRVSARQVMEEIAWLSADRTADGRHADFCEDTVDAFYFYLIFRHPRTTLRDLLSDDSLYLTKRHAREISRQIVRATRSLHSDDILHLDICPENVELVDSRTCTELVYNDEGEFVDRRVLLSSQIRLLFYGGIGLTEEESFGSDQYRSPESVFEIVLAEESDVFSIGCLMFELITAKQAFPKLTRGRLYRREKAILYDALLGPFPDELQRQVDRAYPEIFRSPIEGPHINPEISPSVRTFAREAMHLRDIINADGPDNVLFDMLTLDQDQQSSLLILDQHEYFSAKD